MRAREYSVKFAKQRIFNSDINGEQNTPCSMFLKKCKNFVAIRNTFVDFFFSIGYIFNMGVDASKANLLNKNDVSRFESGFHPSCI